MLARLLALILLVSLFPSRVVLAEGSMNMPTDFVTVGQWQALTEGDRLMYLRGVIDSAALSCNFEPKLSYCRAGLFDVSSRDLPAVSKLITGVVEKAKPGPVPIIVLVQLAPLVLHGSLPPSALDNALASLREVRITSQEFAAPPASPEPAKDATKEAELEYGEPAEMRGFSRIYIDTGNDVDLRHTLAKHLTKKLPSLQVVPIESAELVLSFTYTAARYTSGKRYWDGTLDVIRAQGQQLRRLQTYRHDEEDLDDLVTELGDKFLKDYRALSGTP